MALCLDAGYLACIVGSSRCIRRGRYICLPCVAPGQAPKVMIELDPACFSCRAIATNVIPEECYSICQSFSVSIGLIAASVQSSSDPISSSVSDLRIGEDPDVSLGSPSFLISSSVVPGPSDESS